MLILYAKSKNFDIFAGMGARPAGRSRHTFAPTIVRLRCGMAVA